MQKQIITQFTQQVLPAQPNWLDLESLAHIELTSENNAHLIESALTADNAGGWRAAQPGEQRIRIVFNDPQSIRHIQVLFQEKKQARTQEFLLRWLPAGEKTYQEIVRQQYTFSPPHTTEETEDYRVNLEAVNTLELIITPSMHSTAAYASLARLRVR